MKVSPTRESVVSLSINKVEAKGRKVLRVSSYWTKKGTVVRAYKRSRRTVAAQPSLPSFSPSAPWFSAVWKSDASLSGELSTRPTEARRADHHVAVEVGPIPLHHCAGHVDAARAVDLLREFVAGLVASSRLTGPTHIAAKRLFNQRSL
jgi:hypothetical protein